jgi:MEMO1 family protein
MEAAVLSTSTSSRPAAVAGQFYPAAPDALARTVRQLLQSAGAAPAGAVPPKVVIAPHAGYVYSGSTAARAYATLAPHAERIRKVVLIGPAHRVAVRGVAIPSAAAFVTPLGAVPVDRAALAALVDSPHIVTSDRAHGPEHALEVQLPFLQCVLQEFEIVPLLVGDAEPGDVAEVLESLWGDDETVIVVSSDLSHYLSYDVARRSDAASLAQVLALEPDLDHHQACGATPINALLRVAARRGLTPQLLGACNSGDTAGGRDQVVGYAALAFAASIDTDSRGATLLLLARRALEAMFEPDTTVDAPQASFLDQPGATFVTLRINGELRGCIGSLDAERALRDDVVANARAAASRDPRFAPLSAAELGEVAIEISLLSAAQPIRFSSEEDLLQKLAALTGGVILHSGTRRATFLPQVWDDVPDPREFLRLLKAKAGLAPDFWSPDVRVSHYTVDKWSER